MFETSYCVVIGIGASCRYVGNLERAYSLPSRHRLLTIGEIKGMTEAPVYITSPNSRNHGIA